MEVTRLVDRPIVDPGSHPSLGTNIQGPSLVRVPDWVDEPLGRYYLYFADHKGTYIRLAYADELTGPWSIHVPGSLQLAESCFLTEPPEAGPEDLERLRRFYEQHLGSADLARSLAYEATTVHIASPDVHVDHEQQRFVMYVHGLDGLGVQVTRVATSPDGIHFTGHPEVVGLPYLRAFRHDGLVHALAMPGQFSRSADGISGWENGPVLFEPLMRHAAVLVRDDTLHVLWTRVGDAPERILHTPIDLTSDWMDWEMGPTVEVLRPERSWEGADLPVQPSIRSLAPEPVNQLRDPALYEEDGHVYLLYAVAGESGIALAEFTV